MTEAKKNTKKKEEKLMLKDAIKKITESKDVKKDLSPLTIAVSNDIKVDTDKREAIVGEALQTMIATENLYRSMYMNGNQFFLQSINLHIDRMNDCLQVYEFLYTQSMNYLNHIAILNRILFVIQDMMYKRQYQEMQPYGMIYKDFILNVNFTTVLVNKFNYYQSQLAIAEQKKFM